jgi:ABC-type Zn uptake system ZnuABC Zn-binding protein ZnuA
MKKVIPFICVAALLLVTSACAASAPPGEDGRLKVVASTTIVGDVVRQVGGDRIDLTVLFPAGADPHTFEPRPQDIAALSEAQVVVLNGLDLEEVLEPALESNVQGIILNASEGIEVRAFEGGEHEGEEHDGGDPHTWTDPNNVILWARNIAAALAQADPQNAAAYRAEAEVYVAALEELDGWIRAEIGRIPAGRRKLVADHLAFGYFADEYGLEQTGALIGSFSTNAAPSAQELAALEDKIREQGVPAVFVGKTVNPELAEQVARDTGVKLVPVYTGSLTEPGGEADSYIDFMHYNVRAIVEALK